MTRRRGSIGTILEAGNGGGEGFSRRRFLRLMGALGGTGMAMSAMEGLGFGMASAQNAPPPIEGGGGNGVRVAILGGGLAGMTAAYELSKHGYETPILEARDFAGGRCQTARNGFELTELGGQTQVCDFAEGQYINHGPWRIPFHHRSTLHYTKEFGVPLQVMINENDNAWVLYENAEGPLAGRKVRLMELKADMRGYTAELLAKAARRDALDADLSAEDIDRLVTYLVAEGLLDSEDLVYRGTSRRGYATDPGAGLNPGEPSDPYDFVALLQSGMGNVFRSVNSYSQQYTMLEPVGGMDQLARGFEEATRQHITYGAEVLEIRQDGEGVRIVYRDRASGAESELRADYCLSTIPLSVMQNIPADVSPEFARAMQQVVYQPTGKMGLQFGRRFWEEDDWIYGGHSITDSGNITYPSYGFQGDKGVILGYYNFGVDAIRVSALSPRQRIRYALDFGSRLHPDAYEEAFETGFSVAWHRVPYSLGGWASWTEEQLDTIYPVLNEPDGRLYLAGEHLSYLTGWQAGAIESAWLQIEKIHTRASQEAAYGEGRRYA